MEALYLLVLVCLVGAARSAQDQEKPITINTNLGKVVGLVVTSGELITTRFMGLPYAEAPVGDLRFREPQEHQGWPADVEWNATQQAAACPHDISEWYTWMHPEVLEDLVTTTEINEDCLYLNVFVPEDVSTLRDLRTLSLPVMVYIHGGAFSHETTMLYNGWRLSHFGDVIVVGINYRLNVFGFLSFLDSSAQGNAGLFDQSMALKWVSDNIREFGGDPGRVTIFGESAGAISVGYHMLSPLSNDLFQRAIGESGSALNPCCLNRDPVPLATHLANNLGCPVDNTSAAVDCLRSISMQALLDASKESEDALGLLFRSVIDGQFLPEDPLIMLKKGNLNPADYLLGINSHEGYFFHYRFDPPVDFNIGISTDQFQSLAEAEFRRFFYKDNAKELAAHSQLEYAYCSDSLSSAERFVEFVGDFHFVAPSHEAARLYSPKNKIYFYEFVHNRSYTNEIYKYMPYFIEANHGDELEFVFGFTKYIISNATEQERMLSEWMMRAWTNFAKTGDPNPIVDGVEWRPFTADKLEFLRFTTSLNASSMMADFKRRRMTYWNDYLLPLVATSSTTCSSTSAATKAKQGKTWTAMALLVLTVVGVNIW